MFSKEQTRSGDRVAEDTRRGRGTVKAAAGRIESRSMSPGVENKKSGAVPAQQSSPSSQRLVAAIMASEHPSELQAALDALEADGVDVSTARIFRELAENLQDWAFLPGADESLEPRGAAGAMLRLVHMAGDPTEGADRFRELLLAAVDQVNQGNLARGTVMLALAEEGGRIGGMEPTGLVLAWTSAHQQLDPEKLKLYISRPEKRAVLRRLLNSFPALTPLGLLKSLKSEEKRDTRRLYLALLEVHGAAARAAALSQLDESTFAGEYSGWYFERNLVYLLRHIPRPPEQSVDLELACLERATEPRRRAALIKESLANLGAIRNERSEQILIGRLGTFERLLTKPGEKASPQSKADLKMLIDRTLAALVRLGTSNAYRTVLDYALREKPEPALGDTRPALWHLAGVDLSSWPPLVERLVKELRSKVPIKMLGMTIKVSNEDITPLMQALSGTPLAEVKTLLAEIAERRLGKPTGQFAAKKLSDMDTRPAELGLRGMAGEIEAFDLPMLFQALEEMQASGTLSLRAPDGAELAALELAAGRLKGCTAGPLQGKDAFFQLVERPTAASYSFVPKPVGELTLAASHALTPLLSEGIARHRDLRRLSGTVGDAARYRATAVRPTPFAEEQDPKLLRDVWTRASTGASPAEVEAAVAGDAYRIRRLYAHWVEEGALAPA